jgi:hypothetical protein
MLLWLCPSSQHVGFNVALVHPWTIYNSVQYLLLWLHPLSYPIKGQLNRFSHRQSHLSEESENSTEGVIAQHAPLTKLQTAMMVGSDKPQTERTTEDKGKLCHLPIYFSDAIYFHPENASLPLPRRSNARNFANKQPAVILVAGMKRKRSSKPTGSLLREQSTTSSMHRLHVGGLASGGAEDNQSTAVTL